MKRSGAGLLENVDKPQVVIAIHRLVIGLRQDRRRERNIMVEIQKFDHPTRAFFGRKSDGILDCFRSGGHAPLNEFTPPQLGNFTSAILGSFRAFFT